MNHVKLLKALFREFLESVYFHFIWEAAGVSEEFSNSVFYSYQLDDVRRSKNPCEDNCGCT